MLNYAKNSEKYLKMISFGPKLNSEEGRSNPLLSVQKLEFDDIQLKVWVKIGFLRRILLIYVKNSKNSSNRPIFYFGPKMHPEWIRAL